MQSLGNDFVMLNGIDQEILITPTIARHIADRHFGIGCDQILVAGKVHGSEYGIRMSIFNSDGSEVGQCGNGARCFARYLQDEGITDKERIEVETCTTRLELMLNDDRSVTVGMGVPEFLPHRIPMVSECEQLQYSVDTDLGKIGFSAVSLGNPHCVLWVDDVTKANVEQLGPMLETHPIFPERANIGFAQVVSPNHIQLRVHERGAGETLGCGSGACAAVVSLIRNENLDNRATVTLSGGDAQVEWQGGDNQVFLSGPVETVFEGNMEITLEDCCSES
jgi:diaminopimelate epimerase